ncbi:hypothetical protein [Pseudomonas syringae]|uniref:hypothetical protein n=1 Tax=Pseudomonas syringae TaxID=317 RepID=UPI001F421953|nr:hypothetical protein [Pseudomonas syringae]MCF5374495.1 hypothetical protein [Pseudomonas syringae]
MSNIDFEQLYSEAITEMLAKTPNEPEQIPSLSDLKWAILQGVDCEHQPSPTFAAFFDWWDVFTAYDQMEEGIKATDHKPILRVAYAALKASGDL